MRVVLVSVSYEGYLSALAPRLAEHVDLHLVLGDTAPSRLGVVPGAQVHRFGHRRARHPLSVAEAGLVMRRIRRLQPDVVHVQMPGHPVLQAALGRGWHGDTPLVATVHDPLPHTGDDDRYPLGDRTMRRVIRSSSMVIVLADALIEPMVERFGLGTDSLVSMAHPAIGLDDAVDPRLPPGAVVLFFGRRWPYKGLDVLVRAMGRVVKSVPEARLVVAGTGTPLEESFPHGYPDWLVAHDGYVGLELTARVFGEARVVALPYLEASQSGVAALAVGAGRPMVATAVGGLSEMVSGGAIVIEPGDEQALAEALVVLLRDDERWMACAESLRVKAMGELSSELAAQRHLEIYARVRR